MPVQPYLLNPSHSRCRIAYALGHRPVVLVDDSEREIPPFQMTDAEREANKRYWFDKDGSARWSRRVRDFTRP
ncbi:MAG: hypothetical protein ABJM43_23840 [Paracoccaceae bacterium]